MIETDLQLLARYARRHDEDAFAEIVRRHLDLVFSAALRQVRSPQLAEEVAQSVFTDLARQADRLAPDTILTAWLYHVTRRTAIDLVRRDVRRQLREQVACQLTAMNATSDDWTHIAPLLDDAMLALDDIDRAAVLLRHFENKSLREVGESLSTNEDAARKRVSRAVERLISIKPMNSCGRKPGVKPILRPVNLKSFTRGHWPALNNMRMRTASSSSGNGSRGRILTANG